MDGDKGAAGLVDLAATVDLAAGFIAAEGLAAGAGLALSPLAGGIFRTCPGFKAFFLSLFNSFNCFTEQLNLWLKS